MDKNKGWSRNSENHTSYGKIVDGKVVVGISGTPGCGKSSLARIIENRFESMFKNGRALYINVRDFVDENKIYERYDDKLETLVVDIDLFIEKIKNKINESEANFVLIDGHFASYLPKSMVSLLVVVECDISVLKERLKKRGYSEDKIRENLDSEIFKESYYDAVELGHRIFRLDASDYKSEGYHKKIDEIINKIRRMLKEKELI